MAGRPHRDPVEGGWALPLPTIDPQIVAPLGPRARRGTGPDFRYAHYASAPHLYTAAGGGRSASAALVGLAQVPPARRAVLGRLQPGEGPSAEKRARELVHASPSSARAAANG